VQYLLSASFFLSGWTRMRKRTITARASFGSQSATAAA
jgi:hypothetical protein